MRHPIGLLTLMLLFFATTAPVGALEFSCPHKLDVKESVGTLPDGWAPATVVNVHILLSMDIANEDGVRLGADEEIELKAKEYRSTWRMDTLKSIGGKKFARCLYTSTNMALLRAIPEHVRACTVETKLLNGLTWSKMTCTE